MSDTEIEHAVTIRTLEADIALEETILRKHRNAILDGRSRAEASERRIAELRKTLLAKLKAGAP